MTLFQSDKHRIYTVNQRKVSLSPGDDKLHICRDGKATLAFGHYSIPSVHRIEELEITTAAE